MSPRSPRSPPTSPRAAPLLIEYDADGRPAATWRLTDAANPAAAPAPPPGGARGAARRPARGRGLRAALAGAFLPEGFPASVTPDYPEFIFWHAAQGLSSYIRGILSSHAVLRGVGVGNEVQGFTLRVWSFAGGRLSRGPAAAASATPPTRPPRPAVLTAPAAAARPQAATALGAVFQFFVRVSGGATRQWPQAVQLLFCCAPFARRQLDMGTRQPPPCVRTDGLRARARPSAARPPSTAARPPLPCRMWWAWPAASRLRRRATSRLTASSGASSQTAPTTWVSRGAGTICRYEESRHKGRPRPARATLAPRAAGSSGAPASRLEGRGTPLLASRRRAAALKPPTIPKRPPIAIRPRQPWRSTWRARWCRAPSFSSPAWAASRARSWASPPARRTPR